MANVQNNDSQQLKSDFNNTDNNLQKVQNFLEELDKLLEDTLTILEIPKDVSEGLTDLETTLHIIYGLLTGVMVIPPITAPAKTLRTVVDRLRRQVGRIKQRVNDIEKKIDPHRERLEKMRDYIQQIQQPLETLNLFIQLESMLLGEADSTNCSTPDSRYKRIQRKELEALAKDIARTMVKPMKTVIDFLNSLNVIGQALEHITKLCGTLRTILKPILIVQEELRNIRQPLQILNKTLDQKVGYKKLSFSIRDVFSGEVSLGPPPAPKILKGMANKVMEPLLKGMRFNPLTAIPGLGQIIGLMTNTLNKLLNIQEIMAGTPHKLTDKSIVTGIQSKMTDMFKRKSLETAINRHDV